MRCLQCCDAANGITVLFVYTALLIKVCDSLTAPCRQCGYHSAGANSFYSWVMTEWLTRWQQHWVAKSVPEVLGLRFEACIHLMKQFAHNLYPAANAWVYILCVLYTKIIHTYTNDIDI